MADLSDKQRSGLIENLQGWLDKNWPGLYDIIYDGENLLLYQDESAKLRLGFNRISSSQHPSLAASTFTFEGRTFRSGVEFPINRRDKENNVEQVAAGILILPAGNLTKKID